MERLKHQRMCAYVLSHLRGDAEYTELYTQMLSFIVWEKKGKKAK